MNRNSTNTMIYIKWKRENVRQLIIIDAVSRMGCYFM